MGAGYSPIHRTPLEQDEVVLVCCTPNRTSRASACRTSIPPVGVEKVHAVEPQPHRPTMLAVCRRRLPGVAAPYAQQGRQRCHQDDQDEKHAENRVVIAAAVLLAANVARVSAGC